MTPDSPDQPRNAKARVDHELKKASQLRSLAPFHGLETSSRKFVPMARFHGSQRLNLMRSTRLPANSRRYTHGDPVHLIDWRAFARNEQLIIRQQNDEASARIHIYVETNSSMNWPVEGLGLGDHLCTKRELAWRLALHLAYQFYKVGDRVRLYQIAGEKANGIMLRSQVDAEILFEKIAKQDFAMNAQDLKTPKEFTALAEESSDLGFWISDGFRGIPAWLPKKTSLCWLHTLSRFEIEPDWLDYSSCYFDASGNGFNREYMGGALLYDSVLLRAVQSWQVKVSKTWLESHAQYLLVNDAMPIHHYLSALAQTWTDRQHMGRR